VPYLQHIPNCPIFLVYVHRTGSLSVSFQVKIQHHIIISYSDTDSAMQYLGQMGNKWIMTT